MSGSTFGSLFRVTTWGESHGISLGAVVDGCPAGLEINEEYIQRDMDRRRPGGNKFGTARNEGDKIKILSGVFEGKTTGTPIALAVFNENQKSKDYSSIMNVYRPGHADMGFTEKYGIRDYRGGGRSSGRETLARVAAGAVARKFLEEIGIKIYAYTLSIGNVEISEKNISTRFDNQFFMPDNEAAKKAEELLGKIRKEGNSVGGVVECVIEGMPAGIGSPVFDKLDANIAKAVLSIGATKAIEFGAGFQAAYLTGKENNDEFYMSDGRVHKYTNNSGGVLGGFSDGDNIIFRTAFKPTPSISLRQKTVDKFGNDTEIEITGRHDPVIVPRAVVVVEAMAAITVADLLLERMTSTLDGVLRYYKGE